MDSQGSTTATNIRHALMASLKDAYTQTFACTDPPLFSSGGLGGDPVEDRAQAKKLLAGNPSGAATFHPKVVPA